MSGFLYFVSEDDRPPTPDKLKRWGLGYAFPAGCEHRPINNNSPNGRPGGVIVDPKRHDRAAGYHKDQQTWRKMPTVEGRPELWVGYWNDAKPGPGMLQREKMLAGLPCVLADGSRWEIPVVRIFDGAEEKWMSNLPTAWVACESGGLVRGEKPTEKYMHLWNLTTPIADAMFAVAAGIEADWPSDDEVGVAVVALLQANYVVSASELELLEVVGTDEAFGIVCVASRYDLLTEWMIQKKTMNAPSTPNGESTPDGAAA